MGASNFYYKNAKRLYPLFTDLSDDESEWFDYSEECQNLAEHIDEIVSLDRVDNEDYGNDRNYEAKRLGHKSISREFGDVSIEVSIIVLIRIGYYEGACLDYEIEVFENGSEQDLDGIGNWYGYGTSRMSAGLCAIQEQNATKWAQKQVDVLSNELEEAFSKITQPYELIGRASNGETFYKKV
jgi:hypothetical protein